MGRRRRVLEGECALASVAAVEEQPPDPRHNLGILDRSLIGSSVHGRWQRLLRGACCDAAGERGQQQQGHAVTTARCTARHM